MDGAANEKEVLRTRMRRARTGLAPEKRRRLAALIEERLLGLPEISAAGTIMLFYSFGSEVATTGMAERLLDHGKRLLLPYLEEGTMEAAEVMPGEPLLPTGYGPREPARRGPVDPARVDVVVAPGLAFDRRGRRLGYGGGHYDRYLARLRPEAVRIGIGFSIQVVDEVPAEPTDQALDLLVTDAEVLDCRSDPESDSAPPTV